MHYYFFRCEKKERMKKYSFQEIFSLFFSDGSIRKIQQTNNEKWAKKHCNQIPHAAKNTESTLLCHGNNNKGLKIRKCPLTKLSRENL